MLSKRGSDIIKIGQIVPRNAAATKSSSEIDQKFFDATGHPAQVEITGHTVASPDSQLGDLPSRA
jgi:hypothetical protein